MASPARTLAAVTTAALALAGLGPTAMAAEVVVQNDSVIDGSTATICPCFVAGEHAAVWLTSPCDGAIVAIQVFWRSQLANQPDSLEDSINIRNPGTFPTPGSIIATLEGPVLVDGVNNEYRFFDQNQTIPINIPVTSGQEFVVDFVFFNDNAGTSGPSLVFDSNGVQGQNAIFASGFGWGSNQFFGVSGDWFIRAVIDCGTGTTGACCVGTACVADQTSAQCAGSGGTFLGVGTTCAGSPCASPTGACCIIATGGCVSATESDCTVQIGGTWLGAGTDCAGDPCSNLPGACCIPATGGCVSATESDCTVQIGGNWQGVGTTCPDACTTPPTCPGDLDGDDDTDVFDFGIFASNFGQTVPPGTLGDYDGDSDVDVFDFSVLATDFGCPG